MIEIKRNTTLHWPRIKISNIYLAFFANACCCFITYNDINEAPAVWSCELRKKYFFENLYFRITNVLQMPLLEGVWHLASCSKPVMYLSNLEKRCKYRFSKNKYLCVTLLDCRGLYSKYMNCFETRSQLYIVFKDSKTLRCPVTWQYTWPILGW